MRFLAGLTRRVRTRTRVLGINRRNLDVVFADHHPGKFRQLDDKLATKDALLAAGVAVPETLAVIRSPRDLDTLRGVIEDASEVVVKPARGSGGRGILILERRDDQWHQPGGASWDLEKIELHVIDILSGVYSLDEHDDVALVERRLHPQRFLRTIYPDGLADLRIVLQDGGPVQAMLRAPTRASDGKANLHGGGVGIGVDLKTGRLLGGVWKDRLISTHPDTGVGLVGPQVPEWPRCLDMARRAAAAVEVDYVGVDLVLDDRRGPLVLEVNARPGLAIQIANRRPQEIRRPRQTGRFERMTRMAAWLVLLGLAISPALTRLLGTDDPPQITRLRTASSPEQALTTLDGSDVGSFEEDWIEEESSVSATSEPFAAARALAGAGDTLAAIQGYRVATADPATAPFALNNIALLLRRQGRLSEARQTLESAIAAYPSYPRGHYNLGLVLRDLEDQDGALTAFRDAIELRPSYARAWAGVGQIRFAQERHAEAADAYARAFRFEPSHAGHRYRLGLCLRHMDDFVSAALTFQDVVALDPGYRAAGYWMARSVLDARDTDPGALGTLTADSLTVIVTQSVGPKGNTPRVHRLLAELEWMRGKTHRALRHFEAAHTEPIESTQRRIVVCAVELGLWDRAEGILDDLDPADPWVRRAIDICRLGRSVDFVSSLDAPGSESITSAHGSVMGTDLVALGSFARGRPGSRAHLIKTVADPDRLIADSRDTPDLRDATQSPHWRPSSLVLWCLSLPGWRASTPEEGTDRRGGDLRPDMDNAALTSLGEIRPDFLPLRLGELERRLSRRDRAGARILLPSIRELAPSDPRVTLARIELALLDRDLDTAVSLLRDLPRSDRETIRVGILESRILLALGKKQSAVRSLEDLVARYPRDVSVRVALAEAHVRRGREESAVDAYRGALDLAPGRVDLRRELARSLMRIKHYDEAVAEWNRVLRVDDGNTSDRFNLALSLQRQGNHDTAIAQYDSVIKRRPDHAKAWFNRALALERTGRPDEARAGYARVLELDPDHTRSRQKLGLEAKGN